MELSCHCQAVKLMVKIKPKTLTRCNCSICFRYAALWGYFSPDDVVIVCGESDIQRYIHGDRCIKFCHCKTCGCITHYESTEKVSPAKLAVNYRLAELKDIRDIKIRDFDGAETWTYLT